MFELDMSEFDAMIRALPGAAMAAREVELCVRREFCHRQLYGPQAE